MEGNDKYIKRYPEKDLVHILKNSGYHSSEWEETDRSEEHTSELQSPCNIVCRLLLEKKNNENTEPNVEDSSLSARAPAVGIYAKAPELVATVEHPGAVPQVFRIPVARMILARTAATA